MIIRNTLKTAAVGVCVLWGAAALSQGTTSTGSDTSTGSTATPTPGSGDTGAPPQGSTTGDTGTMTSPPPTTDTTGNTPNESAPTTGDTGTTTTAPSDTTGAMPTDSPKMAQQPINLNELKMDEVKRLQTALNERGATLQVDGAIGPNTKKALTDFQAKNNISTSSDQLSADTLQQLGLQDIMQAH
jgi:hypothetical protein